MADEDPRSTTDPLVVLIDPCLDEADTLILNGIDPVEFLREWREWRAGIIVEEMLYSKQIAATANSSKQLGGVNETATGEAPPASDDPRANPAVQAEWEAKIKTIAATLDKTPPPTVDEIEVAIQGIKTILAQATVSDSLKAIATTKLTMLQYETGLIRAQQKRAGSSTGNRTKQFLIGVAVLAAMGLGGAGVVPTRKLVEFRGPEVYASGTALVTEGLCRREPELISDFVENYRATYPVTTMTDEQLEGVMRGRTTDKKALAEARAGCRAAKETLNVAADKEAKTAQVEYLKWASYLAGTAMTLYAVGDASSKEGEAKVMKIVTDSSSTLFNTVSTSMAAATTRQIVDSTTMQTALAQANQAAMAQSRQLESTRAAASSAALSTAVQTGLSAFAKGADPFSAGLMAVGAGAVKAIASNQELTIQEQAMEAANAQRKLAAIQGLPQPTISALPSQGIAESATTTIDASLTVLQQLVQKQELDQQIIGIRDYKTRADEMAAGLEGQFPDVERLVTAMPDGNVKTDLASQLRRARTEMNTLKTNLESINLKLPAQGASVTQADLAKLITEVTGFRTSLGTITQIIDLVKTAATPRKKGQQSQIPPDPATPVTPQGGRRGGAPTVDPPAPGGSLDKTDQFILNSLLEDEADIDVLIEVRRKLLTPTSSTGARRRTYRKRLGRRKTRAHGAVTA